MKLKKLSFDVVAKEIMAAPNGFVRARCRNWKNKDAYMEKHKGKLICSWTMSMAFLSLDDINAEWDITRYYEN